MPLTVNIIVALSHCVVSMYQAFGLCVDPFIRKPPVLFVPVLLLHLQSPILYDARPSVGTDISLSSIMNIHS